MYRGSIIEFYKCFCIKMKIKTKEFIKKKEVKLSMIKHLNRFHEQRQREAGC